MPADPLPVGPDIARLVRQHLESLRGAGVEWLLAAQEPIRIPVHDTSGDDIPTATVPDIASVEPATDSAERRLQELTVLAGIVAQCRRCPELCSTRTQTVFGVGPVDPEVCFLGEAPGYDEDRRGEPFVGAAGQLLDRIIAACGMKRQEVYICNILRCRPPANRQPLPNEAENCREYLERQLGLVRPKFICALGGTAAKYLLGTTVGITRLRGQWFEHHGTPVLCTFHPAALLRRPEWKKDVWEDMKKLLARMGRPVPAR
jgi:DNA polymerase